MSNGTPVPTTAWSQMYSPSYSEASQLVIGTNWVQAPSGTTSLIWLVVVDLTNLTVVANDQSDGTSVPSDIAQYANSPNHFLFAISTNTWATQMPSGALWSFLVSAGSGPQLNRLAQIYATLGTGSLGTFSYILAATLDESDMPGFEMLSMNDGTILTMAFLPVTVNGVTMYAPIQQGA